LLLITGPAVMADFFKARPGRLDEPDLLHADLMLDCVSPPFRREIHSFLS
jgi:hypothetical protein